MKLRPLSDFGDLFTLQEFIELCKDGCFIDYDGTGYYAFIDKQSDKEIYPSDVIKKQKVDTKFTHVMWYNK